MFSVRRMLYLLTIPRRQNNEITRKVYQCQKKSPLPGDWCKLVAGDFEKMGLNMSDEVIAQIAEGDYKYLKKESS